MAASAHHHPSLRPRRLSTTSWTQASSSTQTTSNNADRRHRATSPMRLEYDHPSMRTTAGSRARSLSTDSRTSTQSSQSFDSPEIHHASHGRGHMGSRSVTGFGEGKSLNGGGGADSTATSSGTNNLSGSSGGVVHNGHGGVSIITVGSGHETASIVGGLHRTRRPRRRADEVERLYRCTWNGCEKSYGTLSHLNDHVRLQRHGNKREPHGKFYFLQFSFYVNTVVVPFRSIGRVSQRLQRITPGKLGMFEAGSKKSYRYSSPVSDTMLTLFSFHFF
jgi:hypothetical protein